MQRFWMRLDLTDLVAVREALNEFLPVLVDRYGAASAELAAQWAESLLGNAVIANPAVDVGGRVSWAMRSAFQGNPTQTLSTLAVVVDELVKQHGRETIADSSAEAGVRWARVPSGAETCAFCLILASRGDAYHSAESAGEGRKFHGDCVLPGTVVSGTAVATTMRMHEGEVVTLAAGGQELTVTANHPVLTSRGWVAAQFVDESDHLAVAEVVDRVVSGAPGVDQRPSSIEDRFRAALMEPQSARRSVPGASEQFHGDGFDSEVHVVARDNLLWDERDALAREVRAEFLLSERARVPASAGGSLTPLGGAQLLLDRADPAANGSMGRLRLGRAFSGRHLFGADLARLATPARLDARIQEPPTDRRPGQAVSLGQGVLTFPGEIPAEESLRALQGVVRLAPVTRIVRRWHRGHVYNLQTESGWYWANSIVTHNCDCVATPIRDPRDLPRGYDPEALSRMYVDARDKADSGSINKIAAAMRETHGIH